ncbi:MAG TPA: universal stress protein [Sphingomicrobium sp.]|nr:universal stress protein [Sphingomicrobium sp.]
MYRNILVPVDLDQPATVSKAIAEASSLARCFGAKLTVCSVVVASEALIRGDWLPISVQQLLLDARSRLASLAAETDHGRACDVEVAEGSVAGGVLDIAARIGADLIVLVSHRPAVRDYLLAANAIRVARRARCSVLIARHGDD